MARSRLLRAIHCGGVTSRSPLCLPNICACAPSQGPVGRGIPTIMEMVVHTRLDCALGSAGLMRQAVRVATHYTSQREAFGARLVKAPAMKAVLADLVVDSEAAAQLALYLARTFDDCRDEAAAKAAGHESFKHAQAFRRLAVAVSKYYITKRCPGVVYEALESIGGAGYVEEWEMARHFRQSPLNAIWEGSGNVIALDILRTCGKEPLALQALLARVATTSHVHPALRKHVKALTGLLTREDAKSLQDPLYARYLVEHLALALLGHALATVASAPQAAARSTDVLQHWGGRHLRGGSADGDLHLPTAFFGTVAPPQAGGSADHIARITRLLDHEVGIIKSAAA